MNLFNSYWLEESDFTEWHEGQIVPVPNIVDLNEPQQVERSYTDGH